MSATASTVPQLLAACLVAALGEHGVRRTEGNIADAGHSDRAHRHLPFASRSSASMASPIITTSSCETSPVVHRSSNVSSSHKSCHGLLGLGVVPSALT